MPASPFGTGAVGQIAEDTLEKLKDQASDVGKALTGQQDNRAARQDAGDIGIEQLGGGPQDPQQQLQQAQKQGLTPQQMAEKQAEQKKAMEYHRNYIQQVDDEQSKLRQEAEMKKKQAEEEEQAKKQQQIVQLQEEQAKSATLQGPSKPKQGRGTAFLPQVQQNRSEMPKTVTQ